MKNLIVLSGAGISAESGLKTFRDSDGLWEGYDIHEVATPEAWERNPELVQRFYNERRKAVLEASPNVAHIALAELESDWNVQIITQNIDNLHERAGSSNVLHLHGIITKSQSSIDPTLLYDIEGAELAMGARCQRGSQLRPHVVWFGEPVPMIERAAEIVARADILLVIGTSLAVYPAAGLIHACPNDTPVYLIDPKAESLSSQRPGLEIIPLTATKGIKEFQERLSLLLK